MASKSARRALFTLVCAALSPLGCGGTSVGSGAPLAGDPSEVEGAGGSGSKGGGGATGGGASNSAGAAGASGGVQIDPPSDETACGDVGRVIFVVSDDNDLLSFDPKTLSFSTIGKLSCPAPFGATPFSMAVDRKGNALVLFNTGNVFRVSTVDASCVSTSFQVGQQGFQVFGMGFVSDATGGESETLFVIDGSNSLSTTNKGLASIDGGGKLSKIGQFDGGVSGRTAEVTGTGDGRLFGFFVDSVEGKSSVAEIDKASAHVISNTKQPLPSISSWAFAHWGGSFYLFHADGGPSQVHKFTPDKGTEQVVANAGVRIVGAGVSTCAPTTEPIN